MMSYYIDKVIKMIDGRTSKCYKDQIPSWKVDLPSNETKMVTMKEFSNPTQKKKNEFELKELVLFSTIT